MASISPSPSFSARAADPGATGVLAETAARSPLSAPRRYLGRKPIVDSQRRLHGYELVLCAPDGGAAAGDAVSGSEAEETEREILDHWLMLIPEQEQRTLFLPCTRTALVQRLVEILPPHSAVLEIPGELYPDGELLERCHELRSRGYRFAVNRFVPKSTCAAYLPVADFVKFDFSQSGHETRREIYAMAGRGRTFLAEKLESEFQMRMAHSEGCSLFQGYFFAQPTPWNTKEVPKNQMVYLRLLAALNRDPVDLRQVEKLVAGDATLCFRLLRLANSAIHAHAGTVSTVREALLMTGENAMRRIVTVAMAGTAGGARSTALTEMALSRARFCELVAPLLKEDPEQLYLLGLLSTLDALLECPMELILQSIPLGEKMKNALMGSLSPAGYCLQLIRHLEMCEWEECQRIETRLELEESTIAGRYVEAMRWASKMIGDLGSGAESRE